MASVSWVVLIHKFLMLNSLVLQVTEEMELSNLAQLYIKDVIKRQCWDEMMVKGKVIKASHISLLLMY